MALTDMFKRTGAADAEAGEEDEQDKKLMDLFQKRNLLKRMYDKAAADLASTKEEADALRRQAEAMGKRLNALDEMLADAEKGQSVIVFYQLAGLWARCNGLLAERVQELSQRHEADEKQKLMTDFALAQRQKLAAAEDKLRFTNAQLEEVSTRKRQLVHELSTSQRLWHYFKRKRIHADLEQAEAALAPVAARHKEQSDEITHIKETPTPDYPGLSVEAKRNINLHLIAMAQYLYQTHSPNSVAQHAQNTNGVLPNAHAYGETRTCLQILTHVADSVTRMQNDAERQLKLSQRYAHLQEKARFAAPVDVLPARELFAAIEGTVGAGTREVKAFDLEAGRALVNVVDGDYFGLQELILK